jgi:hypothetical protein
MNERSDISSAHFLAEMLFFFFAELRCVFMLYEFPCLFCVGVLLD